MPSRTVLLVDDNDDVRELAREVLKRAGLTVLEAPDGAGALAIAAAARLPIDILLTDIVMPRRDDGMKGRVGAEATTPPRAI